MSFGLYDHENNRLRIVRMNGEPLEYDALRYYDPDAPVVDAARVERLRFGSVFNCDIVSERSFRQTHRPTRHISERGCKSEGNLVNIRPWLRHLEPTHLTEHTGGINGDPLRRYESQQGGLNGTTV